MFTIFKDFLDLRDGTKLLCAFIICSASYVQGGQDHFFPKEMLISLSILKLHKNP